MIQPGFVLETGGDSLDADVAWHPHNTHASCGPGMQAVSTCRYGPHHVDQVSMECTLAITHSHGSCYTSLHQDPCMACSLREGGMLPGLLSQGCQALLYHGHLIVVQVKLQGACQLSQLLHPLAAWYWDCPCTRPTHLRAVCKDWSWGASLCQFKDNEPAAAGHARLCALKISCDISTTLLYQHNPQLNGQLVLGTQNSSCQFKPLTT